MINSLASLLLHYCHIYNNAKRTHANDNEDDDGDRGVSLPVLCQRHTKVFINIAVISLVPYERLAAAEAATPAKRQVFAHKWAYTSIIKHIVCKRALSVLLLQGRRFEAPMKPYRPYIIPIPQHTVSAIIRRTYETSQNWRF